MALGALEALKEANRTTTVIGMDGILPAVKQIEAGNNPRQRRLQHVQDRLHRDLGRRALSAQAAAPGKGDAAGEVIDKSNYKAWLVPVEQRACPDWAAAVR